MSVLLMVLLLPLLAIILGAIAVALCGVAYMVLEDSGMLDSIKKMRRVKKGDGNG